jgi:hypothetical protein
MGASGAKLALVMLSLLVFGAVPAPLAKRASQTAAHTWGDVQFGHAPLLTRPRSSSP